VKVCGLTREEDVAVAAEAGADMAGFVLVPESPRAAAEVLPVPDGMLSVAVWVGEAGNSDAVLDQVHTIEEGKVRGREAAVLRDGREVARLLDQPWEGEDPGHWRKAAAANGRIVLAGRDVTDRIRREDMSAAASRVAVHPAVRTALIGRQRAFRQPPGLVADGRDMGTVVFPDATLKVFLTASQHERAERRYKQLIEKGMSDTLESLLRDIRERDARDAGRATAPLAAAPDAVILDTTGMTIAAAIQFVLDRYGAVWPGTTSKH